jgi:hypothetical protein
MLAALSPAYAGITNNHDKAAHVGASAGVGLFMAKNKPFCKWKPWQRVLAMSLSWAAAKNYMTTSTHQSIAQNGETLPQMRLVQYQQRALCGCITKHGNYQNTTTKLLYQRIISLF